MDLTSKSFERLLNWLHPDHEEAGLEYERIRRLLMARFKSHECSSPETLADETIDRVAKTLSTEMIQKWTGPKAKYFQRVGFYILLEDKAKRVHETELTDDLNVATPDSNQQLEQELTCLESCLDDLSEQKRDLITRYYKGKKSEKIKNRRHLAQELGVDAPSLRVQAHRIRRELLNCLRRCIDRTPNV